MYQYNHSGRNKISIIILMVGGILLHLGLENQAPYIWLIIILTSTITLFGLVVINPLYSLSVSSQCIKWRSTSKCQTVYKDEIFEIQIKEWGDSLDVIVLLKNGKTQNVPSLCLPNKFELKGVLLKYGYAFKLQ